MQEREYPTRNGKPIDPYEIATELHFYHNGEYNNHHMNYQRRKFGASILFSTFRDLAEQQRVIPVPLHDAIHRAFFLGPPLPDPDIAMDNIVEAFVMGEPLQIGTADKPIYVPISRARMDRVTQEWERLRCL